MKQGVYIIKKGCLFKFGHTANWSRRWRQYLRHEALDKRPGKLKVIALIETDDDWRLEQMLHRFHAEFHVYGEWFKLSRRKIYRAVRYAQRYATGQVAYRPPVNFSRPMAIYGFKRSRLA